MFLNVSKVNFSPLSGNNTCGLTSLQVSHYETKVCKKKNRTTLGSDVFTYTYTYINIYIYIYMYIISTFQIK